MEKVIKQTDRQKRKYLRKISTLATFGAILFGYDTGVINGSLSFMIRKDQLNLSATMEGLITSSLLLGAALGSLIWGRLADKHGRKTILRILAILFVAATIGCALSPNAAVMISFRVLLGLSVGGVSGIVPVYLGEIAPASIRGSLVSQDQMMIVSGQLMAYVMNGILGNVFTVPSIWRYMLALATIPAIVLWIGTYIIPETPRWLAAQGRNDDAMAVLKSTRDEKEAENDFVSIRENLIVEQSMSRATLKEFKEPWIRRILIIGIFVAFMQQLAGINIMMYYGTTLLEKTGFSTNTALVANIGNGLLSVFGTWIYMVFLANKVRRRLALITGYCFTTTTLLAIGIMTKIASGSTALPYIVIVCTMLFVFVDQMTLGPVTWLVLSEIFPLRVRGLGVGIATFCMWFMNFLVGLTSPILMATIGISNTFLFFVVLGVFCIVSSIILIPETAGKTLEELEDHFRHHKGIRDESVKKLAPNSND